MDLAADAELSKFVAEFVGWTGLNLHRPYARWFGSLPNSESPPHYCVPDYVCSIDAFQQDVWPAIERHGDDVMRTWGLLLVNIVGSDHPDRVANATARQRCLALYQAIVI